MSISQLILAIRQYLVMARTLHNKTVGNLLIAITEPHNSVGTHDIIIRNSYIIDGVASDPHGGGGITLK